MKERIEHSHTFFFFFWKHIQSFRDMLLSHHDYFPYSIHHHFYLERSLYTKKGKEKITIHDMQILTFHKCIGSICKLFLYLHFKMTRKYFGYIYFFEVMEVQTISYFHYTFSKHNLFKLIFRFIKLCILISIK